MPVCDRAGAASRSALRLATLSTVPRKAGPVGPYPPHIGTEAERVEYDKLRRRVLWAMSSGLYVLGTTDGGGRRNGMTINWVTPVSVDPKWVGVAVETHAYTHELIVAGGVFSVCLVAREDRTLVRKFTKPVEVDLDAKTLNGFAYVERVTGAPILAQAAAYLDCEVRERITTSSHTFFAGEVMDAAFLRAEDVAMLRMEDTRMSYGG